MKTRKKVFFVSFILLALCYFSETEASLKIHFLDVGYGDAIVIELPEGGAVLVDSGFPEKGKWVAKKLKKYGIRDIKLAVITHFHPDHAGGFKTIFPSLNPIDLFWAPFIPEEVDSRVKEVREKIFNGPHRIVRRGDAFKISPTVLIQVLHPDKLTGDPNEDSLVLKIEFPSLSVLLTGDIGINAQNELVKHYGNRLITDVIKMPHHGGDTVPEFVKAVSPKDTVLSVGPNSYGLPKPEVLKLYQELGARIHRTDRHGTVTLQSKGETYSIHHETSSHSE